MLTMILLILRKSATFHFLTFLNTLNNTNLQISQINFTLYIKTQLNFGPETELIAKLPYYPLHQSIVNRIPF